MHAQHACKCLTSELFNLHLAICLTPAESVAHGINLGMSLHHAAAKMICKMNAMMRFVSLFQHTRVGHVHFNLIAI